MELRGQDTEIGMPSTLSYNPSHRESTIKLSSPIVASAVGEKRRDQTVQALDHLPVYHHHHHHLPQQSDPNPHQDAQKTRRDPDPNPDPVPALAATGAIITPTSNTGASTLKSPLPQPPRSTASTIRAAPKVRYRECLKNHVASTGGHVVDGCGEFMSSGEEGTPEAFKCAACECHRNFHRKEVEGDFKYVSNCYYANPTSINNGHREMVPSQHHPPALPSPSAHHVYHHHQKFRPHVLSTAPLTGATAPMMMAFGGGGGAPAESSSEDLNMFRSNHVGMQTSVQAPQSKRRFRTKFTQEQKDKMMEFAEKLGWKIQKHDNQEVQQFCSEVGVKRQVFKVWMHNNKQAMKKKQM